MSNPKPVRKNVSKGGRPRKEAVLLNGDEARKRFEAGLKFAIAGGSQPSKKI